MTSTYNDPRHSKPHCPPSPEPVTNEEVEDTSCKAAKVVYRHDDAHETVVRMVHNIEEVLVSNDTAEDALVIAEKNEGQLTGECYGPSCLAAGLVEIEIHIGDVIVARFCPHSSRDSDSRKREGRPGTSLLKDEHLESRSDVVLHQSRARDGQHPAKACRVSILIVCSRRLVSVFVIGTPGVVNYPIPG